MNKELHSRAEIFSALIEEKAMDQNGLVRFCLEYETLSPVTETTGIPPWAGIPGHLFMPYEDSGMATGAYLAAESLHYKCDASAEAFRRAEKAFQAICHIYEMGRNGKEDGFFPKPYGGAFSLSFSRDQYLFVMSGLAEFHAIASKPEQAQIRHMLSRMSAYWRKINYTPGVSSVSQLKDYISPVFLGIAATPSRFERSAECEQEVSRLLEQEGLAGKFTDTLTAKYRRGETYDGAQYLRQNENPLMLKALSVEALWNAFPQYRELCIRSMQNYVSDELFLETCKEDGLNYYIMRYDPVSDSLKLTPPECISELQNPLHIPFLTWGGDRRRAGSTQSVFAAVTAAFYLSDKRIAEQACSILKQLTLEKFHGFLCSSEIHIPSGCEYTRRILYCNYICYWLWDYYSGINRGLW